MLRQICRRGRLLAFMKDSANSLLSDSEGLLSKALQMFNILPRSLNTLNTEVQSLFEQATENSQGESLSLEHYNQILEYFNQQYPTTPVRHYSHFPHPIDAEILPRLASPIQHITHNGRPYSTFTIHPGNSSISFQSQNAAVEVGFIRSIWSQVLQGKQHIFIIVAPHLRLSVHDESKNPYIKKGGFSAGLVYSQSPQECYDVVIEVNQILAHVPYYKRPAGTFGIGKETMVIINSLNRNQKYGCDRPKERSRPADTSISHCD
jgi:hypothetical protein